MLVKTDILSTETRRFLEKEFKKHFKHEEGKYLDSIVSEVLNDRDIFMFLATFLQERHGLRLGNMNYFDDIGVEIHYGLALNFNIPRRTVLFTFEEFGGIIEEHLSVGGFRIPDYKERYLFSGRPTTEQFIEQVNTVLINPKPYVYRFVDKKKIYFKD